MLVLTSEYTDQQLRELLDGGVIDLSIHPLFKDNDRISSIAGYQYYYEYRKIEDNKMYLTKTFMVW